MSNYLKVYKKQKISIQEKFPIKSSSIIENEIKEIKQKRLELEHLNKELAKEIQKTKSKVGIQKNAKIKKKEEEKQSPKNFHKENFKILGQNFLEKFSLIYRKIMQRNWADSFGDLSNFIKFEQKMKEKVSKKYFFLIWL